MMRLRAIDWKYASWRPVNWLPRILDWEHLFGVLPQHLVSARPGHSIRWEAPR